MALITTLIAGGEPEDNFNYETEVEAYRERYTARMAHLMGTLAATAVQPMALAQALEESR